MRRPRPGGPEAWLEDAWKSSAAPFDRDVISTREALTTIAEAKGPRMTIQQIGRFLKRDDIGDGDLGNPRIGPNGKQVRVWAVRDFPELSNASKEVIRLAYGGMPWKKAALEIQKPRQHRDIAAHRLIEADRATAAE